MLTIGRALMTNPDVLILDEATEGLAPLIAREIWRICALIRESGISSVIVDKKSFKGNKTRVTVRDIHIKIDNCVGASTLRSYAVLTSSGTDADDIVAYYGVAKTF